MGMRVVFTLNRSFYFFLIPVLYSMSNKYLILVPIPRCSLWRCGWLKFPGLSQVGKEGALPSGVPTHVLRVLLYMLLYGKMTFDDVFEFKNCGWNCDRDCMYLLVNTAHTYEHRSAVAVTRSQSLKRRCCCTAAVVVAVRTAVAARLFLKSRGIVSLYRPDP